MKRPAPVSAITDKATWPITNRVRILTRRPGLVHRPLRSRRSVARLVRVALSAGANPKITPVTTETSSVKPNTRPFRLGPASPLITHGGLTVHSRSRTQRASTRPAAPPITDRKTLSVISCAIKRPLPTPSAKRRASSFRRPAARTSNRLPTLAHAINRTSALTPNATPPASTMTPR